MFFIKTLTTAASEGSESVPAIHWLSVQLSQEIKPARPQILAKMI